MRTAVVLLLLLVFAAGFDVATTPSADAEEEIAGVEWLTDLDAARAKARKTGRPLLAVFR